MQLSIWHIVFIALVVVYVTGAIALGIYSKDWKIAIFWPLLVLWAIMGGNVQ